jgi:hypothetical protein
MMQRKVVLLLLCPKENVYSTIRSSSSYCKIRVVWYTSIWLMLLVYFVQATQLITHHPELSKRQPSLVLVPANGRCRSVKQCAFCPGPPAASRMPRLFSAYAGYMEIENGHTPFKFRNFT